LQSGEISASTVVVDFYQRLLIKTHAPIHVGRSS
jgi:hypothetical protein